MNKLLTKGLKLIRNHEYDPDLGYRLCALLTRGGNILSVGYNDTAINSFVREYTCEHKGIYANLHAEFDAVLQVRRKMDLSGSKIYVVRALLSNGQPAMAKPCKMCQRMLKQYGVKRATYTINKNEYGIMKL